LVALVGSSGTTTTVVLATPSKGEVRRWQFDSVLVPEAFSNAFQEGGDGLPIGVFVIEYLAEHTYRVRVIDTASGELGLPLNLRDKSQTVDEVMTAVEPHSRVRAQQPIALHSVSRTPPRTVRTSARSSTRSGCSTASGASTFHERSASPTIRARWP
jgi:hypothetical protein